MKGISRRSRNAWAICGVSTLILGTILAFQISDYLMVTGFLQLSWKRPFDAQAWAFWKPNELAENRRWEMVDDLKTHYLKPRMTRAKVLALLGPDSLEKKTRDLWYDIGDDGVYIVGFAVQFDGEERLLRSKIVFN